MTEPEEYKIDRDNVARYIFWQYFLFIAIVGLFTFGFGLLLVPLYVVTIGRWLPRKQAEAFRYRLDGVTIRIDEGVYFLKRKAIPLDRVTDVVLIQGPLMRHFGIWTLQIQTAGVGMPNRGGAEGVLYGIVDAQAVRDALLVARDAAVRSDRTGTGN